MISILIRDNTKEQCTEKEKMDAEIELYSHKSPEGTRSLKRQGRNPNVYYFKPPGLC